MKSIIDYTNKLKDFFAQKQALSDEATTRAKLGAHNLLPNNSVTQSYAGVLFTRNNDGSVRCQGKTTDQYYSEVQLLSSTDGGYVPIDSLGLKVGEQYILSGAESGSNSTYRLMFVVKDVNDTTLGTYRSAGSSETFTIPANAYKVMSRIDVLEKTNDIDVTVYPMLRLATDSDPTYQPYAMTNRKITEKISGKYVVKSNYIAAIPDGTKTVAEILAELYAIVRQKVTDHGADYFKLHYLYGWSRGVPMQEAVMYPATTGAFHFSRCDTNADGYPVVVKITIAPNASDCRMFYTTWNNSSNKFDVTNYTGTVLSAGSIGIGLGYDEYFAV